MQLFRILTLRLVTAAITLIGVAVIVFVVIRVVPGNPIAMMLPLRPRLIAGHLMPIWPLGCLCPAKSP